MFSLLLLALTVIASMIVVRIGSIALEITGLPESQAGFEALSSYTGTGFTTSQSEYAISSPQRKKVITTLIRMGSAGVITTIATLGGTLVSTPNIIKTLFDQPSGASLMAYAPVIGLAVAIMTLFLVYRALRKPAINRIVKEGISMMLLNGKFVRPVSYEEIWINPHGEGFVQVTLESNNPRVGQRIEDLGAYKRQIHLLSVERLNESITDFDEYFTFQSGDLVNCFGPVVAIRNMFYTKDSEAALAAEEAEEESQGRDAPLPVGSKAPVFSLKNQDNETVKLESFRGQKNVVLYFYPKDQSYFCSAAMKEFRDHYDDFETLDTVILAVNPDSVKSHKNFCATASHGTVQLLSDTDKLVCKAYRSLTLGGFWIDRTVYIIDKQGNIHFAERGRLPVGDVLGNIPKSDDQILRENEIPLTVGAVKP